MAYQDNAVAIGAVPPAQMLPYAGSIGYDLNPNFGVGQNPRKAPAITQSGEELCLRIDVVTSFVAGAGAPIAQFHAVLNSATPVAVGNNIVIIGSSQARICTAAPGGITVVSPGYLAADLVAGKHFYIRFNGWTTPMGKGVAGGVLAIQDLRYLGTLITVPNYNQTGDPYFSAGAINAFLVKTSDIMQNPTEFAYPSAVNLRVG